MKKFSTKEKAVDFHQWILPFIILMAILCLVFSYTKKAYAVQPAVNTEAEVSEKMRSFDETKPETLGGVDDFTVKNDYEENLYMAEKMAMEPPKAGLIYTDVPVEGLVKELEAEADSALMKKPMPLKSEVEIKPVDESGIDHDNPLPTDMPDTSQGDEFVDIVL